MAPLIVSEVDDNTPAIGGLFDGLCFFLVQRLPSRSSYVNKVQANGGRVVKLEAQADHIIADHLRKDCPPGSISYTFIDSAIRAGELPDPEDHPAGPKAGTVRAAGSTALPAKGTRTPFTAEDDRVLWQWVERAKNEGGMIKGNEIYKQLEQKNPRHTYQAWRDRYLKKLMDKPPAGVEVKVAANVEPSPPHSPDEQDHRAEPTSNMNGQPSVEQADDRDEQPNFGDAEFEAIMAHAHDISNIPEDQMEVAFQAWAQCSPENARFSPEAWRDFWEVTVLPAYRKQRKERKRKRSSRHESIEPTATQSKASKKAKVGNDVVSEQVKRPRRTQSSQTESAARQNPLPPKAPVPPHSTQPIDISSDDDEEDDVQGHETMAEPGPAFSLNGAPTENQVNADETKWMETMETRPHPSDLNTSDANRKADEQLRRESGEMKNLLTSDLPTSDANRKADVQVRRESGEILDRPHPSDIPTSDANRNANEQLRRDSDSRPKTGNTVGALPHQATSDLATSDANAAPEQRTNYEEVTDDDEITPDDAADDYNDEADDEPTDVVISTHLVEDGSVEDGLPGEELIDPDDRGDPLTEANLASQQSQQKARQLRGLDLPVDDEMQDQSDFVAYLQGVTGHQHMDPDSHLGAQSAAAGISPPKPRSQLVDVTSPINRHEDLDGPTLADLSRPFTRQEIDDMMETSSQWPASQAHKSSPIKAHSQFNTQPGESLQFETQIKYPTLLSQESGRQEPSLEDVEYPTLPKTANTTEDGQIRTGLFFSAQPGVAEQAERRTPAEEGSAANEDRHGHVQEEGPGGPIEDGVRQEHEPEDDYVLDLELAEPEGGFSSPLPEADNPDPVEQPLSVARRRSQVTEKNDKDEDFVHVDGPKAEDVVELSSGSPTSSPYQSSAAPSPSREQGYGTRALETQDIVNAETQQPDLSMPLPPDSDEEVEDEELPRSPVRLSAPAPKRTQSTASHRSSQASASHPPPPKRTSAPGRPSSQSATNRRPQARDKPINLAETQTLEDENLDTWIAKMEVKHNITDEDRIMEALRMTSARGDLAEIVLLEQQAGRPLPVALPGVWTEEEDRIIEGGNARRMKGPTEKHGWDEVMARLEWLKEWRAN
jgi:hypothetical protein